MTSVMRKTHMPSEDASRCCSMSSKWCWSAGWVATAGLVCALSDNGHLLYVFVIVGRAMHDGRVLEVVRRRRRGGLPLQAGGAERVVPGALAVAHRPRQVDHRQQVADTQDRRARGRHHAQHLE